MKDPYITKNEIVHLARLRTEAFDHLASLDLIDVPGDTKTARRKAWSAEQMHDACGIDSLKKVRRSQFQDVKAHFLTLLGRDDEALEALLKGGKSHGKAASDDTPEARERGVWNIRRELQHHAARAESDDQVAANIRRNGGPIGEGYVISIARAQFHKSLAFQDLMLLTPSQLRHLLYTVKARIRKRQSVLEP